MKLYKAVKWFFVPLVLAVMSCLYLCYHYLAILSGVSRAELERNEGYLYYSIQHEANPLDKNMESFQRLYEELVNSRAEYYELYQQYLEMGSGNGLFYEAGTDRLSDQSDAIPCIQISKNLLDDSAVEVAEGRTLETPDFLYEEQEAIPVLMGAGYASIYRIGDVFQAEYLYDPYQFQIVGFLSEGNRISVASRQIELDHSIVMPSFHLNSGAPVTDGLKIHYANKTSGIVKSADKPLFHETVEAILSHSEVGEYSWTVSPLEYQYEEKFQISIGQTQTFLIVTLLLMMAAEIFLSAFISKDKLEYTKVISRKNVVYGTCLFLFTGAVCIGVNLAFMLLFGIRLLRFYHFPGIGAASCGVILMNHLFCKLRNKKQKSI